MSQAKMDEARLRFLTDSAHLLHKTSRGTSSFLMTERNTLVYKSDSQFLLSDRQHSCHACGTIFVPGESVSIRMRRKVLWYVCKSCGRETQWTLDQKPPRPHRIKASQPKTVKDGNISALAAAQSAIKDALTAEPPKITSNKKSSHERKKLRKQSGLQALLANKSSSRPTKPGFDLMDFMKG